MTLQFSHTIQKEKCDINMTHTTHTHTHTLTKHIEHLKKETKHFEEKERTNMWNMGYVGQRDGGG